MTSLAQPIDEGDNNQAIEDEWVEIIEPKSKQKVYANLNSGLCAKQPPNGAFVSRSDDFRDHWWELYDQKSGKYYYYNPEQQKTVWTKPEQTSPKNGKASTRLLIIPVSKLKTLKPLTSHDQIIEKCDAATQTIALNLVSIGSQTDDELTNLNEAIKSKLKVSSTISPNDSIKPLSSFKPHNVVDYNNDRAPKIHQKQTSQPPSTNNLSHYLVREARSMGIALVSDEDMDDDDSDEDFQDDDDTDLRDDASSRQGEASDIDVSHGFSGDGFSDTESPNSSILRSKPYPPNHRQDKKSPMHCATPESLRNFSNSMDDQKNPVSCLSQQLDHRKLVENFKKSRQSSSFGMQDSLGRSANNYIAQKMKTFGDSFSNHEKDRLTYKQARQLSTFTTLPRPHKNRKSSSSSSKQFEQDLPTDDNIADADYDIVEENCSLGDLSSTYLNSSSFNATNSLQQHKTVHGNKSSIDIEPPSPSNFDRNRSTRGSTFSVESFARENLSRHPKSGLIFNRKVKWSKMISWTKSAIKQPMISSVSADLTNDSIASFKLIQQYMGDRKLTITKRHRQLLVQSGVSMDEYKEYQLRNKNLTRSSSVNNSSNPNNASTHTSGVYQIPDRLKDELAFDLVVRGCSKVALRDEIYVQLARQLTENPSQESVCSGLVLMSILLSYFSPSERFAPFLLSFLETHQHQMARDVCLSRLDKRLRQSWLTYCRKPADGKEVSIVRLSITKWPQYCGIFGEPLEKIMSLQSCSPYLKTLRLPWILTTLGDKLINTGGAETEGIFRCAADHDLIAQLRLEIDCVDFRKITDARQVQSLLSNVQDPHVIAGLLKLFFRQLYEPVFPSHLYESCLQAGQDANLTCRLFNESLPNLNKDVVAYLIRLLQMLTDADKVAHTKMDSRNLSMVWAPNLIRAPQLSSKDMSGGGGTASTLNDSKWSISNGPDEQAAGNLTVAPAQSMIFEQTRQEMQFVRSLIANLDTSFIENIM